MPLSQKKEVVRFMKFVGQLLGDVVAGEQRIQFARNQRQLGEQLLRLFRAQRAPYLPEINAANRNNAVSCPVKAFVEATPISGPAWV